MTQPLYAHMNKRKKTTTTTKNPRKCSIWDSSGILIWRNKLLYMTNIYIHIWLLHYVKKLAYLQYRKGYCVFNKKNHYLLKVSWYIYRWNKISKICSKNSAAAGAKGTKGNNYCMLVINKASWWVPEIQTVFPTLIKAQIFS
jgi:hypothetical protein